MVGPTAVLDGSASPENWAAAGGWATPTTTRLGGIVAIDVPAPVLSRVRGFIERSRRGARAAVHLN